MSDLKDLAAPGDNAARQVNADIRRSYDEVPYDLDVGSSVHPAVVLGHGAVYGCLPACGDVLDLGCGTGRMLAAAGPFMSGRLVGVDLSADAVSLARERCAGFGARADIRQADILDLRAEELGCFDLIYGVGVFYIAPPDVRNRMLELIGGCLKPGGMLVISHYAGTSGHLRASVARLLKALDDPSCPADQRIASARAHISQFLAGIDDSHVNAPMLRGILTQMSRTKDSAFFHEVFGRIFDVVETHELAALLRSADLSYLTGMRLEPWAQLPSAPLRVGAASQRDLLRGGYQYAMFGKLPPDPNRIDVTRPQLRWTLNMQPTETETGEHVFSNDTQTVGFRLPWVTRTFATLHKQSQSWSELCETALAAAGEEGTREELIAQLERDLTAAWVLNAVLPLRFNLP
jgi:SAM-dependent methyltransferase